MKTKPVAVLCSDIHLSERAPIARSAEPDWFAAMARPLAQMQALANKHSVPVICAGDVFDHWKSPPALINFALEHLPQMYAVPGQHDLPYHSLDDIEKSAFGTLVRVGRIKMLDPKKPKLINGVWVWGFPWNTPITPVERDGDGHLHMAVVHAYVWAKGASYPGAPEEKRVSCYRESLKGFHVALFGDNHIPFLREFEDLTVLNHGGFMRRKIDEVDHKPAFGLLMSDGTVQRVFQDCSLDKFASRQAAKFDETGAFKLQEFLKELQTLGGSELDFVDAVKHYLETYEVSDGAKAIIRKAMSHD